MTIPDTALLLMDGKEGAYRLSITVGLSHLLGLSTPLLAFTTLLSLSFFDHTLSLFSITLLSVLLTTLWSVLLTTLCLSL